MYKLILADFSNIGKIVNFLKDIGEIENLKKDFGVIERSENLKKLLNLYTKGLSHDISTKILIEENLILPPIYITQKNIEIFDNEIILDAKINLYFNEIKAVILHLIEKPILKPSSLIKVEKNTDIISMASEVFLELYSTQKRIILSDSLLKNHCAIFEKELSFEKNILKLADLIYSLNPKIVFSPSFKIYKENHNYVKYFIKETLDDKELIWMIDTNTLNI